jgi:glutamyl-tRNA reductase
MSVLLVGLSHNSAPVTVLERAAVSGDTLDGLLSDLARGGPVAETFVVATSTGSRSTPTSTGSTRA